MLWMSGASEETSDVLEQLHIQTISIL